MNDPTHHDRDPNNRPPRRRWPDQTPPTHPDPRIVAAVGENGLPRRGVLLAYPAGGRYPVAVAARVAGSDPEQWVAHRLGSGHYHTGLTEVAARDLLAEWVVE